MGKKVDGGTETGTGACLQMFRVLEYMICGGAGQRRVGGGRGGRSVWIVGGMEGDSSKEGESGSVVSQVLVLVLLPLGRGSDFDSAPRPLLRVWACAAAPFAFSSALRANCLAFCTFSFSIISADVLDICFALIFAFIDNSRFCWRVSKAAFRTGTRAATLSTGVSRSGVSTN